MIFSDHAVEQIQELSKKADTLQKVSDLETCWKEMKDILNLPVLRQIFNLIHDLIEQFDKQCARIEPNIVRDFDYVEREMREEFDSPEAKTWFDFSREQDNQRGFPHLKKMVLIEMYQRFSIAKKIEAIRNGEDKSIEGMFFHLGPDHYITKQNAEIEKDLEKLFHTHNVVAWEKQKEKHDEMKEVQKNIRYIRNFHSGPAKTADWVQLKLAIQNVCTYFCSMMETGKALKTIKIKSIKSHYTHGKTATKALLTLTINGGDPIRFNGLRARNLHKILLKPGIGLETDKFEFSQKTQQLELSNRSDLLHKDWKGMNQRIAQKWRNYGFAPGVYDLIRSEGYTHGIHPLFKTIIK